MIPSAIEIFNKETNEKKQNLRNFIGIKPPFKDLSAGLYGVDFCEVEYASGSIDKSDYVDCLEKKCTFRGPLSMMDLHTRTVHEMGLDKEINVDNETWRQNRRKNFPTLTKLKENFCSNDEIKLEDISNKNNRKRQLSESEINLYNKQDPLSMILSKKVKESEYKDILGLCALYPNSDNEEVLIENLEDVAFAGLPFPEELSRTQVRKNKFRFPILPQMELSEKRKKIMNPEKNFTVSNSRKKSRPRLLDMLLASELASDRHCVLQSIRYLCNKRFFDPNLQNLPILDESDKDSKINIKAPLEEPDQDIFKDEEVKSDDDSIIWTDDEL